MFAVTVTFDIAEGHETEFLRLVTENAGVSLAREPGCRQFDVCTNAEEPRIVFLYEVYDDRAAFDAHLRSGHFRQFDAAVASIVDNKRVETYAEVRQ